MTDKIELLSADILEKEQLLADELERLGRTLALSSGWHYLLDWIWVIRNLGEVKDKTILDAGAGIGLLQWYLAGKGAHIISVDRSDRTSMPFHLVRFFNVTGFTLSEPPLNVVGLLNIFNGRVSFLKRFMALARGLWGLAAFDRPQTVEGTVRLLTADLRNLKEIPDHSIEFVVSISALEHNERISDILLIVGELERILVPGGKMIITLPASSGEDWFFTPAFSWCFTETTLKTLFGLPGNTPSNYHHYDAIFEKIVGSKKLRSHVSWRYYVQPNSGLPHGKWPPKYLPVGIIKTKQAQH